VWFVTGLGCALALTPATFLIRQIARPEDLQDLFGAQLATMSACLMVAYSAAGWLGASVGMPATFAILGLVAAVASAIAARLWPARPIARGEESAPR
jgi:predicted MFS family arabinose efflux permease